MERFDSQNVNVSSSAIKDDRRPTRRDLRRVGQGLLASGRFRALLERFHGWEMHFCYAVKRIFALRLRQDFRRDNFCLPVEIRDRHPYVLLRICFLESRSVRGLRISNDQFYTLHLYLPSVSLKKGSSLKEL